MHLPSFNLTLMEKIALLVIVLFALIFFKPVISGDGVGYYAVLEGTVRDHTFNLTNQVRYNAVYNGTAVFFYNASKQYVSQYSPGMALLSAPFYAFSLFLDDFSIFHVKDDFFLEERGDILVHSFSAVLAPLLLFFVALLISLMVCKKEGLSTGPLALVLTFFGTSIIRYATYDLFYTHVAEAGLLALLVYCLFYNKSGYYAGALMGLLTLVRFTSALYLIPICLYFFFKHKNNNILQILTAFAPFVAILAVYFYFSYGSPFVSGYNASGSLAGNFDIIPVGLVTVLFSNQSGLLLWSPIVLLSLFGIYKWKDERKWLLLGVFLTMLWHTSAFYSGTTGYSFGNRYYAALFPVFVLGLALFLAKYGSLRNVAIGLSAYGLVLFLLALSGDFGGSFPTLDSIYDFWFVKGNIVNLPSLVIEKTGAYRLIFEN